MKTVFFICLSAIILSSCGSKSDKVENSTSSSEINTSAAQPLTNPPHGMPGHDCAIPEGAPLPQKSLNTNPAAQAAPESLPLETKKAAVKLNPAHGMPGHRCELAVGAPLN